MQGKSNDNKAHGPSKIHAASHGLCQEIRAHHRSGAARDELVGEVIQASHGRKVPRFSSARIMEVLW